MVRLVNSVAIWGFAWVAVCPAAWAMGPQAPFTPPARGLRVNDPDAPNAAQADASASGLTALRLGHRPHALIDGHWVAVGQAVRGARLAHLTQTHAVLRHADGRRERLPLFAPAPQGAALPAAALGGVLGAVPSVAPGVAPGTAPGAAPSVLPSTAPPAQPAPESAMTFVPKVQR